MTDITVRKMNFEFPDDVPLVAKPDDFASSMSLVGFSFTLPHLEPYLIRTMRTAVKDVTDPELAADMKNFSAQEGFHFRNHARINDLVCDKLKPETAAQMRQIEADMEADYQRFTKEKSTRWNLAYAEGFEAMTLLMAMDAFDKGFEGWDKNWADLYEWHLAEEAEHRTVCFDAYEKIYGGYFYRVRWGFWAQKHFMSYVLRFTECVAKDLEEEYGPYVAPDHSVKVKLGMLSSFMPWYNPRKVRLPDGIEAAWEKYDLVAST